MSESACHKCGGRWCSVDLCLPDSDADSIARVRDRLFGHRRYGTAIHGPDAEEELNGATERFLTGEFATLEAYWANPEPFEADKREGQARINEAFKPNALQQMQAIWDREGQ